MVKLNTQIIKRLKACHSVVLALESTLLGECKRRQERIVRKCLNVPLL